jgi:hypothetical protein
MVHQLPDFNQNDILLAKMEKINKLNGWWRLWVVVSCIWTISVVIYSTTAWFNDFYFPRIELEHIIYTLVLIITPPIIIAAFGKSIAWIIKGFKS